MFLLNIILPGPITGDNRLEIRMFLFKIVLSGPIRMELF